MRQMDRQSCLMHEGMHKGMSSDVVGLLWQVWQDIEDEMQCNKPFSPIEVVLQNSQTASLLGPIQQLQIPANLPPQIMQQVINNILQQIQVVQIPPVDYELFQATLECIWGRSEFRT